MVGPHWTSYVGMAAGLIGAFAGIFGAILGFISYRKSNAIKSLDLRLELRKSINHFNSTLTETKKLLPEANKSRCHVMAADGMFRSGVMVRWEQQFKNDLSILEELTNNAPTSSNYGNLSSAELESKLVYLHKLQLRLTELRNKYTENLKHDDKDRDRLRAVHERTP